jgi:hypothetical protein
VTADAENLLAVASSDTNWELAWEHGIEPIKQVALQSLKSDVWAVDEELAEDSFTFWAAMVLLASYMVGPYTVRVATFLGYPVGFVQVVAARLIQSGIWAGDEVSSEPWLDPQKGMVSFMLDLGVAEGKFTASWSEEIGQRKLLPPRISGRFKIRSLIDGVCHGRLPSEHQATGVSPNAQTCEVAAAEDAAAKIHGILPRSVTFPNASVRNAVCAGTRALHSERANRWTDANLSMLPLVQRRH